MKFNFSRKFVTLAVLLIVPFLQACHTDPGPALGSGASGFFIVDEGAFNGGNASLSFYDRKTDVVINNVFALKNSRALGDQAQSMTIFNGKGYVVIQNSAKIEIINIDDYSSIGTINDGLPSPRYFTGISSSKAYVSDWGTDGLTGTVKVMDLSTNQVVKSIPTGQGADRMLKVKNLVYVTNSGGGIGGQDSTVVVINSDNDEIVTSIKLGDNPNSVQLDGQGNIWVTSEGAPFYNSDYSLNEAKSTKGSISKISPDNKEILRLTVDHVTSSGPDHLSISPDGHTLYYTFDGALYSLLTTATTLPTMAFKSNDYYGLAIDPTNGNIIGCNAGDYRSAGSIDILDSSGTLINSYETGIAPNSCTFK